MYKQKRNSSFPVIEIQSLENKESVQASRRDGENKIYF